MFYYLYNVSAVAILSLQLKKNRWGTPVLVTVFYYMYSHIVIEPVAQSHCFGFDCLIQRLWLK